MKAQGAWSEASGWAMESPGVVTLQAEQAQVLLLPQALVEAPSSSDASK